MILFDIGANRGDAVRAGLDKGFTKIIAVEAAPIVFGELLSNFIYDERVICLKVAAASTDNDYLEFYEASEDGLSTLNPDWLTKEGMPYKDKIYRVVGTNTVTIDTLVKEYGEPALIKIDVEGAEWEVLKGMSKKYGMLTFEWTDVTLDEHQKQLEFLAGLGYTEVAPQFILEHLREPLDPHWHPIESFDFKAWVDEAAPYWVEGAWKEAMLRPTADVGMCWVR